MHEKLVKQLRNTERCCECPYDKDCNEFDSCLMDLLAADAIEDMGKRIARQEKELQEKDRYIENEVKCSKTYEDALEDMAEVICNTCGIGGCPFKHGCEVYSDKACIERIIECFKLNIK